MQIPVSQKIRTYELTFLAPGSETTDIVQGIADFVEKLIKKHKIEVLNKFDWGKKPMAYPIKHAGKKEYDAYYKHFTLKSDTKNIPALEADLRLDQKILRYLLVQVDESELSTVEEVSEKVEEK